MNLIQPASVAWVTIAIGLSFLVLRTRGRLGQLMTPISLFTVTLVLIFGVRPQFAGRDEGFFYGYMVSAGWLTSSVTGLLAIGFLIFGYLASPVPQRARSFEVSWPSETWRPTSRIPSIALAGIALLLAFVAALSARGGGPGFLLEIAKGRSDTVAAALGGLPNAAWAAPMAAPVALGVHRFRLEASGVRIPRGHSLLYWLIVGLSALPPLALGGRRFILPILLVAVAGASARGWNRKPKSRVALAAVMLFFLFATIPFVRSAGARGPDGNLVVAIENRLEDRGGTGILADVFVSHDTEMYDYIALMSQDLGDDLPHGLGMATVGDLLLEPLPAALLPTDTWSNKVLVHYFGTTCAQGFCPVPSIAGMFYMDGGLGLVAFGMAFTGFFLARLEWYLWSPVLKKRLTGFVALGFAPVVARGSPAVMLSIALFVWIMAYGVDRVAHMRFGQR